MKAAWLGLAGVVLAACGSSSDVIDAPRSPTDAGEIPRSQFRDCTGRAYTAAPTQEWQHTTRTPLTLEAGAPNHSGQDQIESTTSVTIPGKFTYGTVSKDLEDELVRVSI